ncbi:MAG TPA: hypothetical protein VND88_12075 [Candidatus Acidoferrales bacterium]|nr:hypothetical protein [Candidatus Acidoferrales bacterium]
MALKDELPGRIEASFIGALAGEHAAGAAAGTADFVGVAESAAACGGFDDADLRQRGLERPSRAGAAGLLLRALPFGLLSPLNRPRLRRDAYRCVAMAGADEGTAVTAVAAALLIADLLRFDLETSLVRVRQSLLEDAPMALLDRLRVVDGGPALDVSDPDPGLTLQRAICALATENPFDDVLAAAAGGTAVAASLAGALVGARDGGPAVAGVDRDHLPHADRALGVAHRLADVAVSTLPPMPDVVPEGG